MTTSQNNIQIITNRISRRLKSQQGGKGKIMRRVMRRAALQGIVTLPSGFGRTINILTGAVL